VSSRATCKLSGVLSLETGSRSLFPERMVYAPCVMLARDEDSDDASNGGGPSVGAQ
jgi:hypothetical protein